MTNTHLSVGGQTVRKEYMKRNKKTWSLTDKEMNRLLGFVYQAQASYEELGFQNMAQEAAEVAEEIYNALEDAGWFDGRE